MRLSKTKILAYINCPRSFKWQFVNELPYENEHMNKGKEIHLLLDKFFEGLTLGEIREATHVDIFFYERLKKLCEENFPGKFEDYKTEINNFISIETKRWKGMKDKSFYLPAFTEVKVIDELADVSGIIDRIEYDEQEGLSLYDYKTGQFTNAKMKTAMFELALYSYLIYRRTGKKIYNVGIIALSTGKVFKAKVYDEMINDALNIVKEVREMIEKDEFPPKEGNCWICPFNKICIKMKEQENRKDFNEIGKQFVS